MPSKQTSQSIEQLQARHKQLAEQKIKIETQRDHASAQLEELKSQAREVYGSDDIEKLKSMLEKMKQTNEEKRSKYQEALDAVDSDLAAIAEKFDIYDDSE